MIFARGLLKRDALIDVKSSRADLWRLDLNRLLSDDAVHLIAHHHSHFPKSPPIV